MPSESSGDIPGEAPAPLTAAEPRHPIEAARLDGYRRAAAMCRAAAEHMEAGRTPAMPGPAALRLMAITFDRACESVPPD